MSNSRQNANLTVATTVCDSQGRFLLVEEQPNSEKVINQPAGHWEPGETLIEAARRETLEETGYKVTIKSFLGYSMFEAPNGINYCRCSFIGVVDEFLPNYSVDPDIIAVYWLSYAEVCAQRDKLRSPMVMHDLDRFKAGISYPLDIIYHQLKN